MLLLPLGPESEDLHDAPIDQAYVTWALVLICFAVHAWIWHVAPISRAQLDVISYRPGSPVSLGLFAYQFVHADIFHLLGNCIFIAAFGVVIERRLGRGAVLAVYLAGGIAGAWLYGALATKLRVVDATGARSFYTPLVGASGALMGLVGCLLPTMPHVRIRMLIGIGWFYYRVVPIPAWILCVGFFGKEVFMALTSSGSRVAYTAHIGGMLGGGLMAFALPWLKARWEARAGAEPPVDMGTSMVFHRPLVQPPAEEAAAPEPAAAGEPPVERPSGELPSAEAGPPLPQEDVGQLSTVVGEVEEDLDRTRISGLWTNTIWTADLQERIRRAHRFERDPKRARTAFSFYKELLQDTRMPSRYRAYSGARMARMLLRAGQYGKAYELSRRLQKNPLSAEIRRHLKQTAYRAYEQMKDG